MSGLSASRRPGGATYRKQLVPHKNKLWPCTTFCRCSAAVLPLFCRRHLFGFSPLLLLRRRERRRRRRTATMDDFEVRAATDAASRTTRTIRRTRGRSGGRTVEWRALGLTPRQSCCRTLTKAVLAHHNPAAGRVHSRTLRQRPPPTTPSRYVLRSDSRGQSHPLSAKQSHSALVSAVAYSGP